jgi:hypothetical protein
MAIHRLRVTWAGSPVVGPGVSTFFFRDLSSGAPIDAIKAFFTSVKAEVAAGVTWNVQSSGDILNETDGSLAGSWSFPAAGGTVLSTGTGQFANGVGARVKWRTNGTFKGRRVVGSTFLVPAPVLSYEGAGNLQSISVSAIQAAGNTLVSAVGGDMVIWSRPGKGETNGEVNSVTACQAPDLVSWLRSRRT